MLFDTTLYLSILICFAGLLWRLKQWFTIDIGPEAPGTVGQRTAAALRGLAVAIFSRRLPMVLMALLRDVLLQVDLFKKHRLRWLMHMLIFWGFGLLLVFHAFEDIVTQRLFYGYVSTLNPFFFLRNFFGVIVLAGVSISLVRRLKIPAQKKITGRNDLLPLLLLAMIIISGFLLEASQIVSEPIFDEMVEDYLGSDDPEEVAPLKAVWARDYHVAFDPAPEITPELLEEGRTLNDESCAVCHSRPTAAFASLPLAILAKPVAATLNRIRADGLLWHLHYLVCFATLALLPFTKFKHLLTTPLTLALRTVGPAGASLALNLKTRRALALDGCTHCGACSRVCSVAPSAQIIGNREILPSEKLLSLALISRKDLPAGRMETFSEGSFICTECYRCTQICPSGIDLQDLWRASKESLTDQGFPELHTRAVLTPVSTLLPVMAKGISSAAKEDTMDLCDDPSTFQACVQCAVCTSVCPVVAAATEPDQDPEIGPHLVTNLLRMQQMELALASRMVWSCVTCYQCQEHCPQHIRVADLLYELRNRGWSQMKGAPPSSVNTTGVQS